MTTSHKAIQIRFDGPPSKPGKFVEVEDLDGNSIHAGQWSEDPDHPGEWLLKIGCGNVEDEEKRFDDRAGAWRES